MAIKVGGTSVISDSRVLQNVTGLKTVNNNSIIGSGNITVAGLDDLGPGIGTTKTTVGTAQGSNGGGGTVSCAAGDWYAVCCSNDNQGGPSSGTVGSGGIVFSQVKGNSGGTIDEHNCSLVQSGALLFYAVSTTTVSVTSNRGTYIVYKLT